MLNSAEMDKTACIGVVGKGVEVIERRFKWGLNGGGGKAKGHHESALVFKSPSGRGVDVGRSQDQRDDVLCRSSRCWLLLPPSCFGGPNAS